MTRFSSQLACVVALGIGFMAMPAAANPRPLPFSYPHEQLTEGGTEIEQYIDYTQVRSPVGSAKCNGTDGTPSVDCGWYGMMQFQTEFEHGITDRLELGLYVTYAPPRSGAPNQTLYSDPQPAEGNGLKQRLRLKLADTGAWPIDVSLYGEVTENQTELELEAKVILQRRIGLMRIIANASAEQEFYYNGQRDLVATPSGGLTFEASPSIQPGVEWWMRAEFPENNVPPTRPFALGPHQYLGPALLLQFGRLWWTNGFYVRLTDRSRTLEPGDSFGNFWVRSVIGLGFD